MSPKDALSEIRLGDPYRQINKASDIEIQNVSKIGVCNKDDGAVIHSPVFLDC
jgi:hypothetical protein